MSEKETDRQREERETERVCKVFPKCLQLTSLDFQ